MVDQRRDIAARPSFAPAKTAATPVPRPAEVIQPPALAAPPPRARRVRGLIRTVLMLVGIVGALATGAYYYATGGRVISTENAYIRADKVAISADVPGRVVEVQVSENQMVVAGDVLYRLDDEPYLITLDRADAGVKAVANEVESLRADYRQKQEEIRLAETTAA